MKLSGYARALTAVVVVLACAVAALFVPLLVTELAWVSLPGVCIVGLLWFVQWVFVRIPKRREALIEDQPPPRAEATSEEASGGFQDKE